MADILPFDLWPKLLLVGAVVCVAGLIAMRPAIAYVGLAIVISIAILR